LKGIFCDFQRQRVELGFGLEPERERERDTEKDVAERGIMTEEMRRREQSVHLHLYD